MIGSLLAVKTQKWTNTCWFSDRKSGQRNLQKVVHPGSCAAAIVRFRFTRFTDQNKHGDPAGGLHLSTCSTSFNHYSVTTYPTPLVLAEYIHLFLFTINPQLLDWAQTKGEDSQPGVHSSVKRNHLNVHDSPKNEWPKKLSISIKRLQPKTIADLSVHAWWFMQGNHDVVVAWCQRSYRSGETHAVAMVTSRYYG